MFFFVKIEELVITRGSFEKRQKDVNLLFKIYLVVINVFVLFNLDVDHWDPKKHDLEYFEYDLLQIEDVERLLNECVEALSASSNVGFLVQNYCRLLKICSLTERNSNKMKKKGQS